MRRKYVTLAVFALVFAWLILIGGKIQYENIFSSYDVNIVSDFRFSDVFVFLAGFVLSFAGLFITDKGYELLLRHYKSVVKIPRLNTRVFALILFLCWLPYIIVFAPGSVLEDSFNSIRQVMGDLRWGNHFPVLYTLFIGLFIKTGELLGNLNIGVLLYSIVQTALMAGVIGYYLSWMLKKGVSAVFVYVSLAFFALFPVFPFYAAVMWKDPLFCCVLLLLSLLLYDIYESGGGMLNRKAAVINYSVLTFLTVFLRNNGVFIVIGCAALILFIYRKQARVILLTQAALLLATAAIQGPIYGKLDIEQDIPAEAAGIPLQQMVRVAVLDGNISEDEKAFLERMLSVEEMKRVYTPLVVDTVKWHEDFKKNVYRESLESAGDFLVSFVKAWGGMFIKNPKIYWDSYCLNTFGFWKWGTRSGNGYIEPRISSEPKQNLYDIKYMDLLGENTAQIRQKLSEFGHKFMLSAGSCFWITLICLCMTLIRGNRCLTFAPFLLLWLTVMVFTPIAFSFRYVFVIALLLPLFLALPNMRTPDGGEGET